MSRFRSALAGANFGTASVQYPPVTPGNFRTIFTAWLADRPLGEFITGAVQDFLVELRKGGISDYSAPSAADYVEIVARKDELVELSDRRYRGEFFTPLTWCKRGHDELKSALGDTLYEDYSWWDMACGTGNLAHHCPKELDDRLFLSTLESADVQVASELRPGCHLFAYDFLNAGDAALPSELNASLTPGSKWVFFVNPPYAAETSGIGEENQTGCSHTAEGERMRTLKLGKANTNLCLQFLNRIMRLAEERDLDLTIGLYSQPMFLTSQGYEIFRERWMKKFGYVSGFCFPCMEFEGTKGEWPVLFSVWRRGAPLQPVVADVIQEGKVVGKKVFSPTDKPLSLWVPRPISKEPALPLTSALTVAGENVRCYRLPKDGLGYAVSAGNTVMHRRILNLLSSAYSSGQGWAITRENMEDSLLAIAARGLVKPNWLNDKDQFSEPDPGHPDLPRLKADSVIYLLFSIWNQSSSLVKMWKQHTFDVRNQFFWMGVEAVRSTGIKVSKGAADPYLTEWMQTQTFSPAAQALLQAGIRAVEATSAWRDKAYSVYQLDRWDAGWYQIRKGILEDKEILAQAPELITVQDDVRTAYESLEAALTPLVYSVGMIPAEVPGIKVRTK